MEKKLELENIKRIDNENQEILNLEIDSPRESDPFTENDNINEDNFCDKIKKNEFFQNFISYIILYYEYLKTFKDINEIIEAIRNYKVSLILVISIFSFINSINLFNESLKGCFEPSDECLIIMTNDIFNNLIYTLLKSSFFLSIFLLSCFNKWIDRKWYIIIIFYFPYFFASKNDFGDHNSYNRKMFISFLIFDLISIQMFYLYCSFLIKKKYTTFLLFSSYLLLIFFVYLIIKSSACDNFEMGIGNISIESDEDYEKGGDCQIKRPDTCNIDLFENFNLFRIINSNCEQTENERDIFIQSLEFNNEVNNSYLFYYPNTISFDWKVCTIKKFKNEVFTKIKPILKNEDKLNKEVIIEFNKETDNGKIKINIEKNETLVKERKKLSKKENLFNNIIIIYINSLSRQQFLNQMKKTSNLLEKYYWKNKKNIKTYQFLKYQVFDENNQLINILPMFYGTSFKKGNGNNIIKQFKKEGYITGGSGNLCSREIFEIENKYVNITTFENFDHENFAMFCDPNLFKDDNIHNSLFNTFGKNKNCLYGFDSSNYIFEYGKQFLNKYKHEKKFLRLSIMRKNINALDDQLSLFLNDIINIDNLIVYIMSDNFQNFVKKESQKVLSLDSLFLIISKQNFSHEKIEKNEQKMITPYDIYYSLLNIIENKNYNNHSNIFSELKDIKRNCDTYSDWNNKNYCKCHLN